MSLRRRDYNVCFVRSSIQFAVMSPSQFEGDFSNKRFSKDFRRA